MSTAPKRKGNSNADAGDRSNRATTASSSNSSKSRAFKKSDSSTALGSRTDTKLSQTSLNTFFSKVRPQDPLREATVSSFSSASSVPSSAPASTTVQQPASRPAFVPSRTVGTKAPRSIIIESSDDENTNQGPRKASLNPAKVLKRPRVDKPAKDTLGVGVDTAHALESEGRETAQSKRATRAVPCSDTASFLSESIPSFMDDMPVSPPNSPTLRTIPLLPAQANDVQESTDQEPDTESRHESSNDDPLLRAADTTPQRDTATPTNVTPQRPGDKSSPFRTPTEKSRHTLSNSESLDLSSEDSVFWARTPPSEALRKLERLSSSRSHDDDIASIVGRLNETSSVGITLRAVAQEPRDRIKEMLENIRGSSTSFQSLDDHLDDLNDLDQLDPASPTKNLLERHRGSSQHRQAFSRHRSAHELGSANRRKGRIRATFIPESPFTTQLNTSSKSREDVLKMIEQMNSNTAGPSQSELSERGGDDGSSETRPAIRKTETKTGAFISVKGASCPGTRASTNDDIPRTPTRTAPPQPRSSPEDFDRFFTDLEMDEQELEELTQLELASSAVGSISSCSNTLSRASNSAGTCSSTSLSHDRQKLSGLDTKTTSHSSKCDETSTSRKISTLAATSKGGSSEDEFDDIGSLGDDFDDLGSLDDFDDNAGSNETSHPVRIDSIKYRRLRVTEVQENIMDNRWRRTAKILVAKEARSDNPFKVVLCGLWTDSQVTAGDVIHVIAGFIHGSELMLNDAQGLLIVKPDVLIPTSVLSESFACTRKPIVEIRARKTHEATVPLTHGTMLHELFQQSLRTNDFSTAGMESRIDGIIKMHLNDLCLVNETLDVARESLRQYIPASQEWAQRYLRAAPSDECTIEDSMGHFNGSEYDLVCVNKVLDIEENIWSPMFGLKGKIDASVQVLLGTSNRNSTLDPRTLIVPFELKTGRKSNVTSHRAQTMLYTLLMTDRYDVNVGWGLLFYLKTGEFVRVQARHDEIRTILMQRNSVAICDEATLTLPPMAKSVQKCRRCFSFSSCTVLHKLLEDGTGESSGLGAMFEVATDHLNETHAEFLRKWNRLLTLEQGDVAKFQNQIWSMLSTERHAKGNCFSNMILIEEPPVDRHLVVGDDDEDLFTGGRFARHRYRFKLSEPLGSNSQQTLTQTLRWNNSLLASNITIGDPIVVSSEHQHYALAIGHVIDMTSSEVVVGLDRPLLGPPMRLDGYDTERNQSYRGLIEINGPTMLPTPEDANNYHSHLRKNEITFRIDKDEMSAGIARTRNNLIQLFRADADGGDVKRRNLVVDLERPVFDPIIDVQHQDSRLNDDQRQAIETVLSARDYALILGMPGTGKTTTIAQIIHMLVSRGKSVLLSSYTHSAVDNVLAKLHPEINIIRLGNKDKVHRDTQHLVPDFGQPPLNTVEAIQNFYGRCQVVGTTCLGIGNPLFATKRFDYCIVDEASQITLPVCLGPIRYADVFILVGDHNQLPPLVKNAEAKRDGYDLSLFKMLSDRYPEAITSLTRQYRMNRDVMLLSNTLVYENKLRCGTKEVADKVLKIPTLDRFRRHCHVKSDNRDKVDEPTTVCNGHSGLEPCWLEQILDSQRSVTFVDTDALPAREVQVGNSTRNPTEALLVRQLVEALISGGIPETDIGIISHLRAQLKVLSQLLHTRPLLDIHTVDRYQGKDKECVIVSLVRSNMEQHVGELLKDWRRINVAFTRAKKKLVVFGSRQTLQGSAVFEQFLQLMEKQKWMLKLPPLAHQQHPALTESGACAKPTGGQGEARRNVVKTLPKHLHGDVVEEEDKENSPPVASSSSMHPKTRTTVAKVARVQGEVILKRMPITKNIIDGLVPHEKHERRHC